MKFTKMHGIGNDYIYINCFEEEIDWSNIKNSIINWSHRHFGIGSDGVIFICPSKIADAKMRMFNADGSEGKMCGNGIRCVGKYVYEHRISKKNPLNIETLSGIKKLTLKIDDNDIVTSVSVNMGCPSIEKDEIPVVFSKEHVINEEIDVNKENYKVTCVSMGNPHCVIFTDGIDDLDLVKIGPHFENHEMFPERINTEFVQKIKDNEFKMRVWERGSGETLACGTGACATVVAAFYNDYIKKDEEIIIHLKGGDLYITYQNNGEVIMRGSATTVFEGIIN